MTHETLEQKISRLRESGLDVDARFCDAMAAIEELVERLEWSHRKFAAVNIQTIADGFSKAEALAVTDLSRPFPLSEATDQEGE